MIESFSLDPDFLADKNQADIEDYICCICQAIPNPESAVEEENCGHIFCSDCLNNWKKKSNNCPFCKENITKRVIKDKNKIVYRHLINLIIKCQEENCDWKGIWKEYKAHLEKVHNKILKIEENNINNNNNHFELNKLYRANIHEHPLKFLGYTKTHKWICDATRLPCKCLSNIDDFNKSTNFKRFRCSECDYDLCENCMNKYYIKNYVIKNDNSDNENIYSLYRKYFTSIHPHPLIFLDKTRNNDRWVCDGKDLKNKCFSGMNNFTQGSNIPRFRCDKCNYDLCKKCMNHYKRKENYELNKFYKIKIHSHPLKFLDKTRNNEDWICNGIDLEDGCLSEINNYKKAGRFNCYFCNFNLCKNCMDYYGYLIDEAKKKDCIIF
jgi:hypothetical protein